MSGQGHCDECGAWDDLCEIHICEECNQRDTDEADARIAELAAHREFFVDCVLGYDGCTEHHDDAVRLGLLVEVLSDEAFREEWGEDEKVMCVPAWRVKT